MKTLINVIAPDGTVLTKTTSRKNVSHVTIYKMKGQYKIDTLHISKEHGLKAIQDYRALVAKFNKTPEQLGLTEHQVLPI